MNGPLIYQNQNALSKTLKQHANMSCFEHTRNKMGVCPCLRRHALKNSHSCGVCFMEQVGGDETMTTEMISPKS